MSISQWSKGTKEFFNFNKLFVNVAEIWAILSHFVRVPQFPADTETESRESL